MKKISTLLLLLYYSQIALCQLNIGLVAYYPFSGSANDSGGYNHHGTVTGAVLTTDRFGIPNNAYQFNNPSDIIIVPDNDSLDGMSNGLTISFWVKVPPYTIGTNILIQKFSHCSGWEDDAFCIRVNNQGRIWVQLQDSMYYYRDQTGTTNIKDNSWHCITYVWNRPNSMIYVDGVPELSGSYTLLNRRLNMISSNLNFGTFEVSLCSETYQHGESLDEVRIYNRALSQLEIDTLSSLVTGIHEPRGQTGNITIYPNPTNGIVNIACQTNEQIMLLNSIGQRLRTYDSGEIIDLSLFDNGLYLIQIADDRGKLLHQAKVLKQE